jgi:type 1 fimbria pilin
MMKWCDVKRPRASVLLLVPLLVFSRVVTAADNMRLYGVLVAEPCVIPPGQGEIQLDFGSIMDKELYQNQRTLGQRFELKLEECDLSLGNVVTVTFTGIENPQLPGLLALEASSEAKGIAIGLETLAGERLPLGKPSTKYDLQVGSNTLALKAYVQGEAKAIADRTIKRGTFRSVTATFKLDYE